MKPKFIVAEVSKNWENGWPVNPDEPALLSAKFEHVIAVNLERGYRLHSFQLHREHVFTALNETIVAVFELEKARG